VEGTKQTSVTKPINPLKEYGHEDIRQCSKSPNTGPHLNPNPVYVLSGDKYIFNTNFNYAYVTTPSKKTDGTINYSTYYTGFDSIDDVPADKLDTASYYCGHQHD